MIIEIILTLLSDVLIGALVAGIVVDVIRLKDDRKGRGISEKEIPKKPFFSEGSWQCGKCGYEIRKDDRYCHHCGQRQNWEGIARRVNGARWDLEWVNEYKYEKPTCSNCKYTPRTWYRYDECPWCGSQMANGKKREENK